MESLKKRIFEIIEVSSEGDRVSYYFDLFIVILIVLNVISLILGSVNELYAQFSPFFILFDNASLCIFTVEYMLRLWTCNCNPAFNQPIIGRIKYIFTPLALIDLFAILPFYIPMILPVDLRFLRILRIMRIFRLLKLARYSSAIQLLGKVVKREKDTISVLFFMLLIILVIVSCLIYYVEKDAQPDVFSSIPASMWWAAVTLTTVGYGDVYPVTLLGKILGTIIALLGIGMFALPAGVLASGFIEEVENNKKNRDACDGNLMEKLDYLHQHGTVTNEEYNVIKKRIV